MIRAESRPLGAKTVKRAATGEGSKRRSLGRIAGQLALIALLLAACEYAVARGLIGSLYLSRPTQVASELVSLLTQSATYRSIGVTLQEFAAGFALSAVCGIATGLVLVLVRGAEAFLRPFLSAFMAVPKVTLIPLLMLWLGIGLPHKVAIVFLFCYFTIAFNTITGIKQTSEQHLKVARVFQASPFQMVIKVILPSAAPTIFAGLRVAAATGLVGALFGEMMASKDGLGNLIVQATSLYDTAKAFALITLVTVLSVLIIGGIDLLEKRIFLKWKSS